MTSEFLKSCQLAIIGAGPAGLAAATQAAKLGIDTVLLDEQPVPGGQVYRNIEAVKKQSGRMIGILGASYSKGQPLVEDFRASGARYEPCSAIWQVAANGKIGISQNGQSYLLKAERIIIATGAVERPVPIPGWTLPGVMSAGAAQTLMKGAGIVPDEATVLAGSGPLLYLVAMQLIAAGVPLKAIIQTHKPTPLLTKVRLLSQVRAGWGDLFLGLKWMAALRLSRVPMYHGRSIRAHGVAKLEAVTFDARGRKQFIEASTLLLHEGVIPNTQLTASLTCAHRWDESQVAFVPVTDEWGATSCERIAVAGDGAGIAGAKAAPHAGRLSALDAGYRLGVISAPQRAKLAASDQAALRNLKGVRNLLDQLYRPSEAIRTPADEDIVCRCEEVSAGEIRALVCEQKFLELNQLKSQSRCGMGQCQGRMCGPTIARILANHRNISMEAAGYYRLRIPVKPLALDELALLGNAEIEIASVGDSSDPSKRI